MNIRKRGDRYQARVMIEGKIYTATAGSKGVDI